MSCCFARASGLYGIFPSAGSMMRLPGPALPPNPAIAPPPPPPAGGAPPAGAPPPRAAPPPPARPPPAPPRAGAGSISVIAGGFQNPCMSGWPSGSLGMGPAGAGGGPPLPRPCPASGATKARVVPTTIANPRTTFFIRVCSMPFIARLLAKLQILALMFHNAGRGTGLLRHGNRNLPILRKRSRIADRRFI